MRLYVYFAFLGLVQLLLLFTTIWELAERHALLQSSLPYVNFFAGLCIKFVKCAHCLYLFFISVYCPAVGPLFAFFPPFFRGDTNAIYRLFFCFVFLKRILIQFIHRVVQHFLRPFVGIPDGFDQDYVRWMDERSQRLFIDSMNSEV